MFINAVKDYLEFINHLYASLSTEISLQVLLQQSFFYILNSIKFILLYVFSFQWVRDFVQLPIILPKINSALLSENFVLESTFENYSSNIFSFLQSPFYEENKFVIGFLNSFFMSLPLSVAHFIALRRLLIQGKHAGIMSFLGTILGQITLIASIIFGLRFLILPWFGLEFLNYLIGIVLLCTIVYDTMHIQKEKEEVSSSDRKTLLKYFALNFGLAWTEQASLFQYLGNINFGVNATLLEISSTSTQLGFFFSQWFYIVGLLIGNLIFSSLFVYLITQFLKLVNRQFSSISEKRFNESLNFGLLITIIGLSITSIPYYSLDYLLGGPLGFVAQDKALDKVQLNYNLSDIGNGLLQHLAIGRQPINTDISLFDRNDYIKKDSLEDPEAQTFESLNYEGEFFSNSARDYTSPKLMDRDQLVQLKRIEQLQKNLRSKKGKTNQESPFKQEESQESFIVNDDVRKTVEPTGSELTEAPLLKSNQFDELAQRYDLEKGDKNFFSKYEKFGFQNFFYRNMQDSIDWAFLKQTYYSNALYKSLLRFDIDLLLDRQPPFQKLTSTEENQLLTNRFLLSKYYDSLRDYHLIPYYDDFENLFDGSKSYADRVYNHQFKGTLNVVRRLFYITMDDLPSQSKILTMPSKLVAEGDKKTNREASSEIVLKFDQLLYNEFPYPINPFFHEELQKGLSSSSVSEQNDNSPFIKEANPTPFYVGWDENLRKLVITNKFLPRESAGFIFGPGQFLSKANQNEVQLIKTKGETQGAKDLRLQEVQAKRSVTEVPKELQAFLSKLPHRTIRFDSWPIPKNSVAYRGLVAEEDFDNGQKDGKGRIFKNLRTFFSRSRMEDSTMPFINLVDKKHEEVLKTFELDPATLEDSNRGFDMDSRLNFDMKKIPSVKLKDLEGSLIVDILPPKTGGFVWPGHLNQGQIVLSPQDQAAQTLK